MKSHLSYFSFVWNCKKLLVPDKVKVRSSHCGSSTESGVSAPQVMVRPDVGSAVSSRPTSPMKSRRMAASAVEVEVEVGVDTNFFVIVEDQLSTGEKLSWRSGFSALFPALSPSDHPMKIWHH